MNCGDELLNRDVRHGIVLAKPTTLVAWHKTIVKNSLNQSVFFRGERRPGVWWFKLQVEPFIHELIQHGAALDEVLEFGAGRRERAQRKAHERKHLLQSLDRTPARRCPGENAVEQRIWKNRRMLTVRRTEGTRASVSLLTQ